VGLNNIIYYKIVVKSDAPTDSLSPTNFLIPLERTQANGHSQRNTIVDRELVTRKVTDANGKEVLQKSSNITISWEKPANWNEIKQNTDPDKDIVFHILLNTNYEEITTQPYPELKDEDVSYGYFPLKYRRVIYFSSKAVKEVATALSIR